MTHIRTLGISILLLAGLLACPAPAEEPASPPFLLPPGGTSLVPNLQRPTLDANRGTTPGIEAVLTNRERENLCPSCKRSRSECYSTYQESKTNPALRDQVCSIYKRNVGQIRARPVPCPVCRHQVHAPEQFPQHEDVDSDLCPHPIGNVKFVSEVTICPSCGFSAFQGDFRRPQTDATRRWVRENLSEAMRQDLHYLLDMNIKVEERELVGLFENQEDIPDIIRTTNAYLYYERLLASGEPNISEAGLAKIAYMTAWSYRREVGRSLFGPLVTEPIKRINAAINQRNLLLSDLEGHADFLNDLYLDERRWGDFDRQIIRILQAGYYSRMGRHRWARDLLSTVKRDSARKFDDPRTDPWFQVIADDGQDEAQRLRQAGIARNLVHNEAMRRLLSLRREAEYLERAVKLIVRGLETGQYAADEIPSYIFLVGDFERRRENFSRAMMWLRAADHLKEPGVFRIEHQAAAVIEDMREYVHLLKIQPESDPNQANDWRLLQVLAAQVQRHRSGTDMRTSAPGAGNTLHHNPAPSGVPSR